MKSKTIVAVILALLLLPLAAAGDTVEDDLLFAPDAMPGDGIPVLVKIRSKSGKQWNSTSRISVTGGTGYVISFTPDELLARVVYAVPGPATARITVTTIYPNPGELGLVGRIGIIEPSPGPVPTVTILSPLAGEMTTANSSIPLSIDIRPIPLTQVQLINLTSGIPISFAQTDLPAEGRTRIEATIPLIVGVNTIFFFVPGATFLDPAISRTFTIIRTGPGGGKDWKLATYLARSIHEFGSHGPFSRKTRAAKRADPVAV